MNIRIVVADEREASFFDAAALNSPWSVQGSIRNPVAGLKDSDLESDREGRRFGGIASNGQMHHHGVDGERSAERHELTLFAKQVAQCIDSGRVNHEFDRLILVAPPKVLGLLRQGLSAAAQALLTAEVAKDVVRRTPNDIRAVVPREAFFQLPST
jgi:protein required for attachment to host cells